MEQILLKLTENNHVMKRFDNEVLQRRKSRMKYGSVLMLFLDVFSQSRVPLLIPVVIALETHA